LIPLKRSTSQVEFPLEIVFVTPSIAMNGSGTLKLEFARFNTPIGHAFFKVYLPRNYRYGEFEGNVKEVAGFSQQPKVEQSIAQLQRIKQEERYNIRPADRFAAKSLLSNVNIAPQMIQQMPMQQQMIQIPVQQQTLNQIPMQQMIQNVIPVQQHIPTQAWGLEQQVQTSTLPIPQLAFISPNYIAPKQEKRSGVEAGVMPVTVKSVKVGQCFRFEKLLLSEDSEKIQLCVPFKKISKPFNAKRHLFPYKTLFFGIGLMVTICLFLMFFIDVGTFYRKIK
jgi:hypothetical protein